MGKRSRRSRSRSSSRSSVDSQRRRRKRSRSRERRERHRDRDRKSRDRKSRDRDSDRDRRSRERDKRSRDRRSRSRERDRRSRDRERRNRDGDRDSKSREQRVQAPAEVTESSEEAKKRQRLERLRQWREAQESSAKPPSQEQKEELSMLKALSFGPKGKRKRLLKTRLLDAKSEETNDSYPASSKMTRLQQLMAEDINESIDSHLQPEDQAGEVDPLDAYMANLAQVRQDDLNLAIQQSNSRDKQGEELKNSDETQQGDQGDEHTRVLKVITADEIFSFGKKKFDPRAEETFHQEFLAAVKRQREEEMQRQAMIEKKRVEDELEAARAIQEGSKEIAKGDSTQEGVGLMAEDDGDYEAVLAGEALGPSAIELLKEKIRKKDLKPVDHSKIEYIPFRKNFYVEAPAISTLSDGEITSLREELEMKVRGAKPLPAPIEEWSQAGLSERVMNVLKHRGWEKPFPIQRQALPIIMSGRDMIGVAKTGSGKTLAFILPMFRHILDQPPLQQGDGPIALLMAPARELAVQIHDESRKFAKVLGLQSTCCYGGVGIKDQISAIKRGCEILVATPGRLIDLLCTNNGRLLTLTRVTYVVLDEADRMFDMGFEPQVMRVIRNTRPDRQIVMFSATFPPVVERVARAALHEKPVILVIGGRAKPSGTIQQFVEVREPQDKFPRLLQLLGEWYEAGSILVFVKSQETCDKLFQQLLQSGYRCLSLHGGKDQVDRDFTIQDFKQKKETLMVATSVAGRGLDVPDLRLVINYDVPNHLEDYIHRIGRTGRAGKPGTAYTFISSEEEKYSPDLVRALRDAKQEIPPELLALNDSFREKIDKGEAKFRGSGYRGHGYTFDEGEKTALQKQEKLLRKQQEIKLGLRDADADDEFEQPAPAPAPPREVPSSTPSSSSTPHAKNPSQPAVQASGTENDKAVEAKEKVRRLLAEFGVPGGAKRPTTTGISSQQSYFNKEIVINDYPQQARYRITHRDTADRINDLTGCAVVAKGVHVPPGRSVNAGERPLYLVIEGPSDYDVSRAANEVMRILEETTMDVGLRQSNKASTRTKREQNQEEHISKESKPKTESDHPTEPEQKKMDSFICRKRPFSQGAVEAYLEDVSQHAFVEIPQNQHNMYPLLHSHISKNLITGDASYMMGRRYCDSDSDSESEPDFEGFEVDFEEQPMAEARIGLGFFSFRDFEGNTLYALHEQVGDFVGCESMVKSYIHLVLFSQAGGSVQTIENLCSELVRREEASSPGYFGLFDWNCSSQYWNWKGSKPARDIDTIILPEEDQALILEDMENFQKKDTREFYQKHGIPYRRSYLFYGIPGAGKSSLIQALAGRFKRSVSFIQPSHPKMTDDGLKEAMDTLPRRTILVFEDIDALFDKTRHGVDKKNALTFSGLLNALDGLSSAHGQIIVLTTNFRERLDDALIRDGRVDLHLHFDYMSAEQIRRMFASFFPTATVELQHEFADAVVSSLGRASLKLSPAALQGFFVRRWKVEPEEVVKCVSKELIEQIQSCVENPKDNRGEMTDSESDEETNAEDQLDENKTEKTESHIHVHVHLHEK